MKDLKLISKRYPCPHSKGNYFYSLDSESLGEDGYLLDCAIFLRYEEAHACDDLQRYRYYADTPEELVDLVREATEFAVESIHGMLKDAADEKADDAANDADWAIKFYTTG